MMPKLSTRTSAAVLGLIITLMASIQIGIKKTSPCRFKREEAESKYKYCNSNHNNNKTSHTNDINNGDKNGNDHRNANKTKKMKS